MSTIASIALRRSLLLMALLFSPAGAISVAQATQARDALASFASFDGMLRRTSMGEIDQANRRPQASTTKPDLEVSNRSAFADAMMLPLQLRIREALEKLRLVDGSVLPPGDRDTLACMQTRFGSERQKLEPASTESNEESDAAHVIDAYQRYWRGALLRGPDSASIESASSEFLDDLRRLLGEGDDADWEQADARIEEIFNKAGMHVQLGITPPLRELIAWADERIVNEQANLPDGTQSVRVVFMGDFKSRGWAHFATCGRSSVGGWTATDSLYAIADSYDTASEHYRVSYLAHEAQHFRDKRRFTGNQSLPPWRLEYRAKLVELAMALADQASLLELFAANTSSNPAFPHSHANQRVLEALDKELPGHGLWNSASEWSDADAHALRRAARALLARDDQMLERDRD